MIIICKNQNQDDNFSRELASSGLIGETNRHGSIIAVDTETQTFTNFMCGCGGSMFMCAKHASALWRDRKEVEKKMKEG